jgi:cytochrome c oxidase cbb3-type subunit III
MKPVPARLRRRWGWASLALAILVAAAGGYWTIDQANMRARLVRADPGAIVQDPELRPFALALAKPAYKANCAGCHGESMKGDPAKGVPNLTDQDWLYGEGRVAQIEHTILYGIRSGNSKGWNLADMPGFARPVPYSRYAIPPLEPGEIRDVIEFMVTSAGKPGDMDAAARGAKVFAEKGQCFDCHSNDAQGDSAIGAPNLIDNIWLYGNGSREDIYDTVARGRAGVCPEWLRKLSAATIRALAVLIYTASHPEGTAQMPAQVPGQAQSSDPPVGPKG